MALSPVLPMLGPIPGPAAGSGKELEEGMGRVGSRADCVFPGTIRLSAGEFLRLSLELFLDGVAFFGQAGGFRSFREALRPTESGTPWKESPSHSCVTYKCDI